MRREWIKKKMSFVRRISKRPVVHHRRFSAVWNALSWEALKRTTFDAVFVIPPYRRRITTRNDSHRIARRRRSAKSAKKRVPIYIHQILVQIQDFNNIYKSNISVFRTKLKTSKAIRIVSVLKFNSTSSKEKIAFVLLCNNARLF